MVLARAAAFFLLVPTGVMLLRTVLLLLLQHMAATDVQRGSAALRTVQLCLLAGGPAIKQRAEVETAHALAHILM